MEEKPRVRQGNLSELEHQAAEFALDINTKLHQLPPRFTGKFLRDLRQLAEKKASYYNHVAGRSKANYVMNDVREKVEGIPYGIAFDHSQLREGLPYEEHQIRNALDKVYRVDDGLDMYNIGNCWTGPYVKLRLAKEREYSLPEFIDLEQEDLAMVTFRDDINKNIYGWQTPQYGGKEHFAKIVLANQVKEIPARTEIKKHDAMKKRATPIVLRDVLGQIWSHQRQHIESKLEDRGYIWDNEMRWGMDNMQHRPTKEHPSLSGNYPKNRVISVYGKRYPFYMSDEALKLIMERFTNTDLGMEKIDYQGSTIWCNISQLQQIQNKRFKDE